MSVISETEERTTRTPAGAVAALAAPSVGSKEICTWRVEMAAGSESPLHLIDREQVWMPTAGAFEFTIDGETSKVGVGQAIVVPAEAQRQFRIIDGPAHALVAMAVGGRSGLPGSDQRKPLPWAQ